MPQNMKFVIRTKNPLLLKLLYDQIDKMLKKKFKKEMKDGKAMLIFAPDSVELIALDPILQEEFKKSFKKNMKGVAKVLQKGPISKLYGDLKMELIPCD